MRRAWFITRGDLAEPAAQLALLRIVVAAFFPLLGEVRHAPELAAVPAALRVVPEGLHWFVAFVPITPLFARIAQAICIFASLCAIAGVRARLALAAVTLSGFYLLALSQLSGWVWHDMHLLWMAALLAASPCDEALAFDAPEKTPRDGIRYGLPLQAARALLACIYVFPGIHKLATSGIAWALSDNLRNQLYWKWAEHGAIGHWRVDHIPGFLQGGGLYVLAFECLFPIVLFVPRVRPYFALAGIGFHLFAWALLRIPFASLWALYVVLLPPAWIRRLSRKEIDQTAHSDRWSMGTLVTALVLVVGAFVQGARGQMRSFPFACYPTFQWRPGVEMPDLLIEAESADGTRTIVPHARDAHRYRTQRQWGEIWSLAGVNDRVDPARLAAYFRTIVRTDRRAWFAARGAVRVRFQRAFVDVLPEHRGREPRRGAVLATMPLE